MFPGRSQRARTLKRPEEIKPSGQDLGSSEYADKGMAGPLYDVQGNAIEVF